MKVKNKIFSILLVVIVCCSYTAKGQYAIERDVIASAGAYDTVAAGYTFEWTIGEPLVDALDGSNKMLTQGFHQAKFDIKSNYNFDAIPIGNENNYDFKFFPNPVTDYLTVTWNENTNETYVITISDMNGRGLGTKYSYSGNYMEKLSFSGLTEAYYVVTIVGMKTNLKKSFLILKRYK